MNEIAKYLLLVSVSLALLYTTYKLFFKRDTLFKVKRGFFIFLILFSLLYPFCKVSLGNMSHVISDYQLPIVEINLDQSEIISQSQFHIYNVVLMIMLLGSIFLLLRFLLQLMSIVNMKHKNQSVSVEKYQIIDIKNINISPFSFFNWIFINSNLYEQREINEMIEHEKIHVNQRHTLDVLVIELLSILFWWNPIVWMLKKEIKINLEYLADEGVLKQGYDPRQYQYLLLQTSNPDIEIRIVNNFNVSQLKKRITMINKKRTSQLSITKYILTLPVLATLILMNSNNSFAQPIDQNEVVQLSQSAHSDDTKPFTTVEQMPQYPGGDAELMNYIGQNLKYPEDAIKNNTEGKLVVRFVVTNVGKITDVSIVRSLSTSCDAEAARVVKSMPDWIPGKQNGVAVPVYYTLPILFKKTKETDKIN